jgi:uncharacterized protein YjdB
LLAKWSSSSKAVATVSGGKISGLKKGKATISATYNGKTVKITIEVKLKKRRAIVSFDLI